MKKTVLPAVLLIFGFLTGCGNSAVNEEQWVSLFNGHDLSGWTIKMTGYPVGENYGETFRVEDGLLKVRYDQYDEFGGRFGHIFTDDVFTDYILRVEYRFVGEQAPGAPGWAYRNNGAMLHSQSAESMGLNQDFPVSVEAQLLGGNGTDERPTGNMCSPGTDVHINGEMVKGHCYNSRAKTYHGDQWVTMDMIVYGDSIVHHVIEGDTVLTYTNLTVTPTEDKPERAPLKKGHIAFQGEGHPTDFRRIEILELK